MTEYSRHDIASGALTARDVSQVLREAVFGRRTMTKIGSQSWEQVYACHFEVDIEGWRITIYNDCDELDYCERCVSPDGQRWDFDLGDRTVSVRRTHLPNSSFKGDGVRVFLSGRDHPYRQDFHAPTKLLSETVQSPGRSGMPATWRIHFQCRHQPWHQCQRYPQMAAALSRSAHSSFTTGIRPAKSHT